MWLAGGVDREKWYGHRFVPGQVVECAIRDNEGHAQGTVVLEIAAALSTDDQGHWVTAKFVGASDAHMQWWMTEGAGKKLAAKCAYHFCEESSHDCTVTRRGASIHVEKFRVLGQKEFNNRVPAWAFGKAMGKHFMDFLSKKGMEPKSEEAKGALPWVDPGGEGSEEEEDESSGSPAKEGLKSKLLKARDEVKRLERELSGKKAASKDVSKKLKKEKTKRKKKSGPVAKDKKKRKKEKGSPSSGGGKKKKKAAGADEERVKESRVVKRKKKDIDESSSYSEEEEEGLFGEGAEGKATASSKKGRRDRGPFGGGDIVRFQGESSSDSEAVFREAPTVPKASNQLKLMQYAKRTPGRLASRLLLKMQVEGAQGTVGANPADQGVLTPPAAVHYFHTTIVPQLGQRLGMRAHREMRTTPEVKNELTQAQKLTVDHLRRALDYVEERKLRCGRYKETAKRLADVRFDYQGEPVVVMEDIRADKVIAAWPGVGQAAVQDALSFLPEKLKAKMLDPASCLKPVHEWPSEPHQSRVRASDDEWCKVVKAAHERGLMVAVELDEVFKDQKGRPVLNGAGAVKKEKKIGGKVVQTQRFISNLIPSNMFQDRLEGDDKLLPYLGQLTLLEQEEDEVWLVDSEDFTSCFNLFRLPPVWYKFMAFEKPVDASLLGGAAGRMVYPAMAVLPMGWVSSVAVVQSIVRSLVFKEADIPVESEIAKTQPLPADEDLTVIYLDSYDQLRKFKKG